MNPVRLRGDRMNPVRTIERIIKAPDIHWVGNSNIFFFRLHWA